MSGRTEGTGACGERWADGVCVLPANHLGFCEISTPAPSEPAGEPDAWLVEYRAGGFDWSPWAVETTLTRAESAAARVETETRVSPLYRHAPEPSRAPDGWVLLNKAGGRVNVDGSVIWQEREKAAHYAGEFTLTPVYFGAPASEPSERLREAPEFALGEQVYVESGSYTGPGIVGQVTWSAASVYADGDLVHWQGGKWVVDVTPWIGPRDFSHGYLHTNTWRYPVSDVRRLSTPTPEPEEASNG